MIDTSKVKPGSLITSDLIKEMASDIEKTVKFDNNGNVGIGTTNPSTKLDVRGPPNETTGMFSSNPPPENPWPNQLAISGSGTGSEARLGFGTTKADGTGHHTAIIKTVVPPDEGGDLVFMTRSPGFGAINEHMRITNKGKIGIGLDSTKEQPQGRLTLRGILEPAQGLLTFFSNTADIEYDGGNDDIFIFKNTKFNGKTAFIGGNVGIGTTPLDYRLEVEDGGNGGIKIHRPGTGAGLRFNMVNDGRNWQLYHAGNSFSIGDVTAGQKRLTIDINGNVGIGTDNPQVKLDIKGEIAGGGTRTGWVLGSGGHLDDWLRLTKYTGSPVETVTTVSDEKYHALAVGVLWSNGETRFDLAEVTPVKEEDNLEQGDVVVIDKENGLRVIRSTKPVDTSVYGIISSYESASMVIGGGSPESVVKEHDRLPVALAGRVKVKASAEGGAIRVGDMLVTSSTPGHVMQCSGRYQGAVVGKALEPLERGKGMITVLVILQ